MKKALIFCNHRVPVAEPNAIRLINIGLMLKELGYDVTLFGAYSAKDVTGSYKGINYVEWGQTVGHGIKQHNLRKKEYLINIKKAVVGCDSSDIIISALGENANRAHIYLRKTARDRGAVFIQSIVEWYVLANFGGWKRAHRYFHNEYLMRHGNQKSKNIIGISTLLCDYYKAKGCNSVYIPTMVDMEEYKGISHAKNDRIVIAYAGSPRRKDCIANAILALLRLDDSERAKFVFNIYGAGENDLIQVGISREMIKELGDSLCIHGRIPYEEVKQHVANADFTVLLRRNTINANAGFSTKVGESMACGTPVIANITGDLAQYIIDGKTGVICSDESVEACVTAYRRILTLSDEEIEHMREKCVETAGISFNYRTYINALQAFIGGAK